MVDAPNAPAAAIPEPDFRGSALPSRGRRVVLVQYNGAHARQKVAEDFERMKKHAPLDRAKRRGGFFIGSSGRPHDADGRPLDADGNSISGEHQHCLTKEEK